MAAKIFLFLLLAIVSLSEKFYMGCVILTVYSGISGIPYVCISSYCTQYLGR